MLKDEKINVLMCRLGFHYWKYPSKTGKTKWVKGTHRICRTCGLEQTKIMLGGWMSDFDE